MVECDKCEIDVDADRLETISLDEEYELCEGCQEGLTYEIENHYWYDRYTKEQHERAVSVLEEQDEILCVHGGDWRAGEIIVHTNYVSSEVVSDVCNHFGLQIAAFGPRWQEDDEVWDECVGEMGSCFEVLLDYTSNSPQPLPLEAEYSALDVEWLDDNDEQFEADPDRKV